MFKRIVTLTVVIIFTLLLSCRRAASNQAVFTANSFEVNAGGINFSNDNKFFDFGNFAHAFTSLFALEQEQEQSNTQTTQHVRISDYDDLMKQISASQGHDWRFLSAIAYNESRFKEDAESHMGARGLMQIMPIVAREFNVDYQEVSRPEVNIMLAAKLLTKMEDMLRFSDEISDKDRLSLLLASYNGGIGHVSDARRLTRKYGGNAESWEDVAHFLSMKAYPEYHNDDVVKYGCFRGSNETLTFVDRVLTSYEGYCAL